MRRTRASWLHGLGGVACGLATLTILAGVWREDYRWYCTAAVLYGVGVVMIAAAKTP